MLTIKPSVLSANVNSREYCNIFRIAQIANAEEIDKVEATKKRNQRQRSLEHDAEETHRTEAAKKRNQRICQIKNDTQRDHLRNFKRAVLFVPIFICSCCHVKH